MLECTKIYFVLTAQDLFHPSSRPEASWSPEEEHLAQMIEYIGSVPPSLVHNGNYSEDYLEEDGELADVNN